MTENYSKIKIILVADGETDYAFIQELEKIDVKQIKARSYPCIVKALSDLSS